MIKGQIIYKTNKNKLFQYEIISIDNASKTAVLRSFSSLYKKTCSFDELSCYQINIPKYSKVATIANLDYDDGQLKQ